MCFCAQLHRGNGHHRLTRFALRDRDGDSGSELTFIISSAHVLMTIGTTNVRLLGHAGGHDY